MGGTPHTGDHDAEHSGDLAEQHALSLHTFASDFSCADSPWKTRHKGVPQASGSVPVQCRSKTVIGIKVMQKAWFHAGKKPVKTPQARARCGVFAKTNRIFSKSWRSELRWRF
ncbi:TPA: hypothetical protein ACQVJM_005788 [Serratia marcescens]